jgi:succinate dehydrogenase / fumarate reductase iron-sulfur subunit
MHSFHIYRFDPDADEKPRMQVIEVEVGHADRMLLDVLTRLKAIDPSLSFRRSCREGICGSDAMNINGKNGLACVTNMRSLPSTVVLKPLPGLPVIRDLFVDMTGFFKQYHSIRPWLVNDDPPPERERLQSPEARAELDGLYECILCACCSSACPSFLVEPRQVRRAGRFAAGLPLSGGQPRSGQRRTTGQPSGSLPPVPMPNDPELHRRLSQRVEPRTGHRQDQADDGATQCLSAPEQPCRTRISRLQAVRALPNGQGMRALGSIDRCWFRPSTAHFYRRIR